MAPKKTGLGSGLAALMGDAPPLDIGDNPYCVVPLSAIDTNPDQPRKRFEETRLEELAQSIRVHGVIQPIIVQPGGQPNRYRLVAGERRFRASMLAGVKEIPVIVQDLAPREAMERALIENIQRQDLNPLETARALSALLHDYKLTQEQLAERLGMSRAALANSVRLLQLPMDLQEQISDAGLSAGHVRALLMAPDRDRPKLLQRIIGEGMSVRRVEAAARALARREDPPQADYDPHTDFSPLCRAVRRMTGMHCAATGTLDAGKIILSFQNRAQLDILFGPFTQEDESF